MGLDPHPEFPEDRSRSGPEQDPGRAHENQAVTSAQFADGQRFDAEGPDLRMQPRPAVPPAPSHETTPRLAA